MIVESEFEKIISTPPPKAGEKEKASGTRNLFENPEEQEVAKATFEIIRQYERLRGSDQLQDKEIQKEIVSKVEEIARPKRASEVSDDVVQSKADAAAVWCEHATVHAKTYGGKPWTYLLIPHDQIATQMSLSGLAARCTHASQGHGTGSLAKG